ncbi:MAG: CaiB/BaiF CoA-transferase family protein [Sphingomonadales bacterium]|jgi:alpha-methylacyl-CoA racemase
MGPLSGFRIIEIAGIGPGPFCAMMLADQGAEVIRVDRAKGGLGGVPGNPKKDILNRGRKSIAVDLKSPEGVELVLKLIESADGLVEGFRPGVMERLGLGPEVCLKRNPKLVYGRMTGWGQDGPWASMAGHDIDYIALSGALHSFGRAGDKPVPPINLVGDFGGGGMFMAYGMLCGLLSVSRGGEGQIVDAAMVDGSAVLMTMMYALKAMGVWRDKRGTNLLDTGAHFYEVYETRDAKHLAIGAIEPQFYQVLMKKTGLIGDADFQNYMNPKAWPVLKTRLAEVIRQKNRSEWEEIFAGTDGCVAPVLSMEEAPEHPHNKARNTFVEIDGVVQPAPAPRFSKTPNDVPEPPSQPGENSVEILKSWGFEDKDIQHMINMGTVVQNGEGG